MPKSDFSANFSLDTHSWAVLEISEKIVFLAIFYPNLPTSTKLTALKTEKMWFLTGFSKIRYKHVSGLILAQKNEKLAQKIFLNFFDSSNHLFEKTLILTKSRKTRFFQFWKPPKSNTKYPNRVFVQPMVPIDQVLLTKNVG